MHKASRSIALHRLYVGAGVLIGAAVVTACGDTGKPPIAQTMGDTADQVVFGLNHQLTIDGAVRTRLLADTAFMFQVSQTSQLRNIKVTFFTPEGRETSTLTARRGRYDWRTGDMEARDTVVAVTPEGRRLTTSVLKYVRVSQSIDGPEAFVFVAGERHLEGDGFTSDPDFRNVVTKHPRKGTLGNVELGH